MAKHQKSFVRDKQGQIFAKMPNGRYQPVTETQADEISRSNREGSLATAGRAALGSIQEIGGGVETLAGRALGRDTSEIDQELQTLREQQSGRDITNPAAALAGQFAPDVAIGLVTAGATGAASTLARTAGKLGLVEFATQAPIGAARNPDTPFTSGALQGTIAAVTAGAGPFAGAGLNALKPMGRRVAGAIDEIGGRVRGRVTGRSGVSGSQAARGADGALVDRAGLPPGVPSGGAVGADVAQQPKALPGTLTSAETDALGVKVTPAQRRQLDAVDPEELAAADRSRRFEELRSGDDLGNTLAGNPRGIVASQDEAINNRVLSELGVRDTTRLTDATMTRVKKDLTEGFDEFQDLVDPGSLRSTLRSSQDVTLRRIERNAQGIGEGKTFEDIKQLITGTLSEFSGRDLTRKVFQMRTQFDKEAANAFKAQNFNTAEMYSTAEKWLDQSIGRELVGKELAPGVSALDSLQALRDRWGIFKAIERSPSSRDPGGGINTKTFFNNWKRFGQRQFGPGEQATDQLQEFARFMETMQLLTAKVVPSSGTSERLLANLPGIGAKYGLPAVGLGGASALGLFN